MDTVLQLGILFSITKTKSGFLHIQENVVEGLNGNTGKSKSHNMIVSGS